MFVIANTAFAIVVVLYAFSVLHRAEKLNRHSGRVDPNHRRGDDK